MRSAFIVGVVAAAIGCGEGAPAGAADAADAIDASVDALAPDAGEPMLACDDALADVFVTPAGLPPLTPATRGAVVRCAPGLVLTAAEVEARAAAAGATITATSGVRIIKLAYRTVRGDGVAAVTTATAYLPSTPRATPTPVALFARSTAGLADRCAPSHDEVPHANQALPLAGLGYAVIAPDLAGLGNEGVHLYLDNREAATQLFDGARALAALAAPGTIGAPEVALGYSQGGGVVLSAQALERELTGGHSLRGVVAIAPEWPIRVGSFGYERVLRDPDGLTGTAGLAPPTVTVMRQYGWFTNRVGAGAGADSFPPAQRAALVDELESLCTIELGAALGARQPRLRDLVDDGFRVAMLACIDGAPGCVEPARGFHAWLAANVVDADPAGAAVLVIAGLADQVMPAASETACVVDKLVADGVRADVCVDSFATHDTVLERKIEHGLGWLEAVVGGQPRPSCGGRLPTCAP